MRKKALLAILIAVFFSGTVFAQADFESMPQNTITVDIGPIIIGGVFGLAENFIGDMLGEDAGGINLSTSGFGIGAQYERQILERLSVAGRFAFLRLGMGLGFEEDGLTAQADMNISSFAVEGRARFFPTGGSFFLGGMLGYANLATAISGHLLVEDQGVTERENVNFRISRGYLKVGARVGWRIDFGEPGGFVFEPSFGWYGAIGFGDNMGRRFLREAGDFEDLGGFDEIFTILEHFVFVGGPRLSLSFGWRF